MVSGESRRRGVAEKGAVALTDGRCQSPETSEQIFRFCFLDNISLLLMLLTFWFKCVNLCMGITSFYGSRLFSFVRVP